MANTAETRTTYANMLKDVHGTVQQATAERSFLLSTFERTMGKQSEVGENFIFPVVFDNNGSYGSRGEGGTMPTALPGSNAQASVTPKYHYFTMSLTGPVMKTSETNVEAFAQAFGHQLQVKSRSFRQNINRQLNGDGNGILCQVDGAPSGVYITVDNAFGQSGFNSSAVNGAKFITSNMLVDFFTGTTVRDSGDVKIVGVTKGSFPSTSAILDTTGSTISSVADGDYCYVADNNSAGTIYEMEGMDSLIDDGTNNRTWQGISTSTYDEWKSVVKYGSTAGTAEALTTNRIQEVVDEIETNGGMVDWMLTSNAVWLTYGEQARSENQVFSMGPIDGALDTGWSSLQVNGKRLYKDPMSMDHIYFVDNRAIKILQSAPMGWLDYGDGILHRDGNKDQWQAEWAWYAQAVNVNRSWLGKLEDISVTANAL